MPQRKAAYHCFIEGFSFLNKNIEIYVVLIAIGLISTLLSIHSRSIFGLFFSLAALALNVFYWGYIVSVPVFFTQMKNGKHLNYKYIRDITLQTIKRLIVPMLIIGPSFILLITSVLFVQSIISNSDVEKMIMTSQNIIKHPNYLVIFLFSFFFSFKHLRFVVLAFLITIVSDYLIRAVIPVSLIETTVGIKWWGFFYQGLSLYPSLVVTASALLYYQDYQKK